MAAPKIDKKRKRSRKARTEVSSSSSSSSDSESASISLPPPRQPEITRNQDNTEQTSPPSSHHSDESLGNEAAPTTLPSKQQSPQQAFEAFYLQQATKEFANDLDKLRSAPDFNDRSVPVLIEALRQGEACFAAEEKRRIAGELP